MSMRWTPSMAGNFSVSSVSVSVHSGIFYRQLHALTHRHQVWLSWLQLWLNLMISFFWPIVLLQPLSSRENRNPSTQASAWRSTGKDCSGFPPNEETLSEKTKRWIFPWTHNWIFMDVSDSKLRTLDCILVLVWKNRLNTQHLTQAAWK